MKVITLFVLPFLMAFAGNTNELFVSQPQEEQSLIGKKYIDVSAADPEGIYHSISDYVGEGKWILIDFWASWCGPCRGEMPNVVAAYEKYHDKGFEIIGFSFDADKESWVQAIEEMDMTWVNLSDLKGWGCEAGQIYGIEGIPDNYLIGPDGTIIAGNLRGERLEECLSAIFKKAQITKEINALMKSR